MTKAQEFFISLRDEFSDFWDFVKRKPPYWLDRKMAGWYEDQVRHHANCLQCYQQPTPDEAHYRAEAARLAACKVVWLLSP